jgi:FlgN protein.
MERDYERLVQYLTSEKKFYSELLEISPQKKKAIIANDIDVLNFIVEKEKNIIENIEIMGKNRIQCIANIGRKLNLDHNPTLKQIIDTSKEDVSELENLQKELKQIVTQLKAHNSINNDLARIQLDFIYSFKSAFFDGQGSYGVDGKDVDAKRQSVNLLDRMV